MGGLRNHSERFGEEKYRLPLSLFEQQTVESVA